MTARRMRAVLLGATALLAGLMLLAWSQPWFTLTLSSSSGDPTPLEVRGDVAAGALAPLALAVLAVVAALALSGRVFRIIFGVLEALLGVCVVAATLVTLGDPAAASASAITEVTGIAGSDSVAALVAEVATSAWPFVAIVIGALTVVVGGAVVATARRWPVSGRKYTRTRVAASDASDSVAEWDALSEGDDPTSTSR